ncbi:MAG TPA: hypothetical protein VFI30_04540 [Nocardioidaceae bacterium]|nr:hypothetical protein [Nocardioidaceae bacterium]
MSTGVLSPTRARIQARTLRPGRWWLLPLGYGLTLLAVIVYLTYAVFVNKDYYWAPYISPMYSPCLPTNCVSGSGYGLFPSINPVTPALIIIIFPAGLRATCYYYRKAYYRSFFLSPPACAVAEPHRRYSGESKFPMLVQNVHRYFFYITLIFNALLTYDAVLAFRDHQDHWGHMGLGTLVLCINAILLWLYNASCHSCRHVIGGRLRHFSKHPIRYKLWSLATPLNAHHGQIAWASLVFVALTDLYVRLVAGGAITDVRFF